MKRILQVNIVFLITVLLNLLISLGLSYLPAQFYNDYYMYINLAGQLFFALPAICYVLFFVKREEKNDILRFKKVSGSNIALTVVFLITLSPLLTFLNALSMMFATNVIGNAASTIIWNNPFLLGLLTIAIMPAFFEEFTYRGVMLGGYRNRSVLLGVILSAFLFGMMHRNINQFMYAFALGFASAMLVEATGSIIPSMFMHLLMNSNSVVLIFLVSKFENIIQMYMPDFDADTLFAAETMNASTIGSSVLIYGIFALIGTPLAFLIYRTIAQNADRWGYVKSIFSHKTQDTTDVDNKKKLLYWLPLILGIIILAVEMILVEI